MISRTELNRLLAPQDTPSCTITKKGKYNYSYLPVLTKEGKPEGGTLAKKPLSGVSVTSFVC
jgi:hypothetical protein|uniref:Uncharacterized protein n=1 Tax=Picea glauca TaxID=3330 RepID=A0A101M1K4_PICGL|nr:hypothetical protein ABT39_MTgene3749 [Picea glauca]QHR87503.1 hypothetical protein Q903MT_gene1514 [Picea sitchensis]